MVASTVDLPDEPWAGEQDLTAAKIQMAELVASLTETSGDARRLINAQFSAAWPNITEKKDPPTDADEHKGEGEKFDKYFSPEAGEGDA